MEHCSDSRHFLPCPEFNRPEVKKNTATSEVSIAQNYSFCIILGQQQPTPLLKDFQVSTALKLLLGRTFSHMLVPGAALRDAKEAAGMNKHLVIHPKRDCGKHP